MTSVGAPDGSDAATDRPAILVVDDDHRTRNVLAAAVRRRFGADYAVIESAEPDSALAELERLRDAGRDVALIAANQAMTAEPGTAFLARTRDAFPTARRLVLASYFDASAMRSIARASTLGEIDALEALPWSETDERFLAAVAAILADWAREHGRLGAGITIVGKRGDAGSQLLGEVLERWGIPVTSLEAGSAEGERLLTEHGVSDGLPFVALPDGRTITEATVARIADTFGYKPAPQGTSFDVAVLGLGPAGFSAAVNAASEGLRVVVVEPTFSQASSSPMIRNYLGFPAGVTGAELLRRAWYQILMFGFEPRIGRAADSIQLDGDQHVVVLDDGARVRTASVVLATGVAYRRIGIPSVDRLVGRGVFYGYGAAEAQALEGESVAIVGGANSAAQAAAHLARYARQVRLIIRGPSLSGSASEYLVEQVASLGNVVVHPNTEVVEARGRHQLRSLVLRDKEAGTETEHEGAGLFILIGATPRTDWLPAAIARDEKGYVLTGDDVPSAGGPEFRQLPLETTAPGIFAAGDVRHGSVKRVAAAVGEGAAAIPQVLRYLESASRRSRQLAPSA